MLRLASGPADQNAGGKAQDVAADGSPASDRSDVVGIGGGALEQAVVDADLLRGVR